MFGAFYSKLKALLATFTFLAGAYDWFWWRLHKPFFEATHQFSIARRRKSIQWQALGDYVQIKAHIPTRIDPSYTDHLSIDVKCDYPDPDSLEFLALVVQTDAGAIKPFFKKEDILEIAAQPFHTVHFDYFPTEKIHDVPGGAWPAYSAITYSLKEKLKTKNDINTYQYQDHWNHINLLNGWFMEYRGHVWNLSAYRPAVQDLEIAITNGFLLLQEQHGYWPGEEPKSIFEVPGFRKKLVYLLTKPFFLQKLFLFLLVTKLYKVGPDGQSQSQFPAKLQRFLRHCCWLPQDDLRITWWTRVLGIHKNRQRPFLPQWVYSSSRKL